jgi:hypothetical protein
MKIIFKILLYILSFIVAIFLFLPKESLYNFAEKELEKNKIIISNEKRDEKLFGLDISNGDIYYENINIANMDKIAFKTFLVYSELKVKDIKLLKSLESMAPTPIDEVIIKHSLVKFNKIDISAIGSFGELVGEVDILTKVATLELTASSKMKNSYSKILKLMKLKEGKYYYEYKF